MAIGAVLEPLVVVSLLAFGTIVNRNKSRAAVSRLTFPSSRPEPWQHLKYSPDADDADVEIAKTREDERTLLPSTLSRSNSSSSSTLAEDVASKTTSKQRQRRIRFMSWEREVTTPNTEIFRDRFLSRVLQRFPFLVEVWYWALIYWVCSFSLTSWGNPCSYFPRSTNSDAPSLR
jgi:hypothetical protein